MAQLNWLVKALSAAIWEMGEAFTGLEDKDVWVRPHPRLLSIGEIARHVGMGEAHAFLGVDFESPFMLLASRYYSVNIEEEVRLEMGSEAVYAEIKRIHQAVLDSWEANPHESEDPNPHREGWTWGQILEYQGFHVAYHTGQIYSVRHLLGHETVDN